MKQLTHRDLKNKQQKFPISIVCDAIRTPENIGMCFRVAESFGAEKIFLHESSPFIENTKVVKTRCIIFQHCKQRNASWR